MVVDLKNLIKNYTDWLLENIALREINNYIEITLPFLDRNNDYIQIYLKDLGGDRILMTDAGHTVSDLEMFGFSFNSEKRQKLLTETVHAHGINIVDENELQTTALINDFPQKLNDFIQTMQDVDNLASSAASYSLNSDVKL